MCRTDQWPVFGLFRQKDAGDLKIYSFNPDTATWTGLESHIELPRDIVQLVLVPGNLLALTACGTVLMRKMDRKRDDFVVVARDCRKLLQGGQQCFGFFDDDGEISVRHFNPYLGRMDTLDLKMADHFDSCSRVDAYGNVCLYIAGEDFEFPDTADFQTTARGLDEAYTRQAFGPGLLVVQIDFSGYVRCAQFHDIILERGCVLEVNSNIVSLWLKGFREVVRLSTKTLSIEWVEWIGHERPLREHRLLGGDAISCSIKNSQFLFHRKPTRTARSSDLNTYKLQLSERNNRRCWTHVSTFLRVELLCIFDGRFALHCEKF